MNRAAHGSAVGQSSSADSTQSDPSAASSASTSSTSSSASTASTSSASNSSAKTLIEIRQPAPAGGQQVEAVMRQLHQVDGDQTSSSTGANSQASSRRYRNSPFGLTRHYLSMPEGEQLARPAFSDLEDDLEGDRLSEAPLTDDGSPPAGAANNNNTSNHHHKSPSASELDLTGHSGACDLSVLAPSTVSSASDLHAYSAERRRLAGAALAGERKQRRPPNRLNHRPAGDAGLDAAKCHLASQRVAQAGPSAAVLGQPAGSASNGPEDCYADDLRSKKLKLAGELASRPDESAGLLVRFSSIMYATFLVILGCILHVSELRQKSKNSTDHIYTSVVALMGICWLLFLQVDLQRYKRYASKFILIETIFNDHRQLERAQRRLLASGKRAGAEPSARSTSSSSASLVNDRLSMNTEVIFKKTAYKMYQHRVAQLDDSRRAHGGRLYAARLSQDGADHHFEPALGRHHGHLATHEHPISAGSIAGDSLAATSRSADLDAAGNLIPAYKFLHGKMGANFYLKCGMAAFCFGHVIHEGLRFGQQVYFFGTGNLHCRDSAALLAHLITPLYSFYQLFMMFKYSNLVINRHKVLARFGLMHIIGTSVTFWIRTILEEAFEDFVHKMDYFKTNKPQMNLAGGGGKLAEGATAGAADSNLASLLKSFSDAIKSEASERSDWSISATNLSADSQAANIIGAGGGGANFTVAQSLLTLMSSPISATITPQMVRHLPDSYACAQNTLLTTKSMNALPYLYPFTIEYNLLLAATFLSLYFNIGKIGPHGTDAEHQHDHCRPIGFPGTNAASYSLASSKARSQLSSSTGSNYGSSDHSSAHLRAPSSSANSGSVGAKELIGGEYKSNFVVNADCHSANKGLFCGFFVLLVTLVTIVIFFVTINKPTHIQLGIKINLIQEATLTALILVVTLAGFKQVVKLNRNPYLKDKVTTDDVLMLIPLPFFFIHSLLSFRAETATMSMASSMSLGSGNGISNTFSSPSSGAAAVAAIAAFSSADPSSETSSQISLTPPASLSTILLGGSRSSHLRDPIESASGGNLQSILLSNQGLSNVGTSDPSSNIINNNNNNNIDDAHTGFTSHLNDLLAAGSSGTSSRVVEDFISSNNGSRSKNGNNIHGRSGVGGGGNNGGRNISNNVDALISGASSTGGGNGNSSQVDHFKLITVALNIIVMIEVLVQTNFIIDGMRRCSESRYLRFKKPGRELITFAILLNITYWIVATFETKSVEQYKTEIEYYGPLPYMFISHTTLPVMLFYRYHSSVCLAEIWNRAYKSPKKR